MENMKETVNRRAEKMLKLMRDYDRVWDNMFNDLRPIQKWLVMKKKEKEQKEEEKDFKHIRLS